MVGNGTADSGNSTSDATQVSQGSADSKGPSLDNLVPAMTDAPKGEVNLGQNAGAFGPWSAHKIIDEIAKNIAHETVKSLARERTSPERPVVQEPVEQETVEHGSTTIVASTARILVVSDRLILPSDWLTHYVYSSLDRLKNRLETTKSQLDAQKQPLRSSIVKIDSDEASPAATQQVPSIGRRRGVDQAVAPESSQSATNISSLFSGALDDAVNLLGLLRTDYTITATTVTTSASELSTLTAAHLANPENTGDSKKPLNVTVQADSFFTAESSPSVVRLRNVLSDRDAVVEKISELQALLSPVQAELAAISTRATTLEQAWATAMADKKDDADIALMQATLDKLASQGAVREQAIAAAASAVAYAQQVVADTDAATAAFLQPSGEGEAPLLTAARFERLDRTVTDRDISHILYVNLDAVAADAVTRQSLIGSSGRISFLSSGNASWLLFNTKTNAITDGGQESLANAMTFSLDDGKADVQPINPVMGTLGKDPLDALENWAKGLVLVFALALIAASAISFIAVIRIAFGK